MPQKEPAPKPTLGDAHVLRKELDAAKQEQIRIQGELDKERAYAEELEEQLRKANATIAAKAPPPLPEAAEGAVQLAESATFVGASSTIITGLPGDLVFVGSVKDARAMQSELGAGFRVHAVTEEVRDSLGECGFLT